LREEFRLLVGLQDLDIMIKEVKDSGTSEELKSMGFKLTGLKELQQAREKIAKKIPPALLNRYEKLAAHYKLAILPVTGDKCLGCFVKLPTSFFSSAYSHELLTCESCGRMLYIP
jgi:predicted  nucleic acid-binding Zn-ribbon protein